MPETNSPSPVVPSRTARALVAWVLAAVVLLLAGPWLDDVLVLIVPLAWLCLVIWGFGLFVNFIARRRWDFAAAFWVAIVGMGILPIGIAGHRLNLASKQPGFDGIVETVGDRPREGSITTGSYKIERYDPLIVYFQTSIGFIDHGGFIYDESDSMPALVTGSSIGGALADYQVCMRLKARWYRCGFS